jgi:dienelactone hydrolase
MGRPATPAVSPRRPTRAEWADRLLRHATLMKPPGTGPFPLVMQLHGCGGLRPFMKVYAEEAVRAGYAVLVVDSFKPRGLSRIDGSILVCTGLALHGAERSADVYALYDWARRQPWIDKRRIVAAGWSHGGWTIMDALALHDRAPRFAKLADLPPDPLEGLAAAVLVYPYASFPSMTLARGWRDCRPKVHALLCGRDQVVGVRNPARAMERLERDGLVVDRLHFPDATHAFDDEGASDPRTRYRADLRAQAAAWYGAALRSV